MAGKIRPSLRAKTLQNVALSNLSLADKKCIEEVFKKFEELATALWCENGWRGLISDGTENRNCL